MRNLIGNVQFLREIQRDVCGLRFTCSQLHQLQLYQTVAAAYAQFEDNKPLAVIAVEESIGFLAFVLHRAVMQHIFESAFHLEHLAGCEAGQFQMRISIGGKNEVVPYRRLRQAGLSLLARDGNLLPNAVPNGSGTPDGLSRSGRDKNILQ